MVDIVDKRTRSRMMSGIKGTNTKPELLLRQALHVRGFRYRIHDKRLPGNPDIVLAKWRVAIQVHGCFWHRHEDCPKATMPRTNVDFWWKKFDANVARDKVNLEALLTKDWRVLIVWECAIGQAVSEEVLNEAIAFVEGRMHANGPFHEIGAA